MTVRPLYWAINKNSVGAVCMSRDMPTNLGTLFDDWKALKSEAEPFCGENYESENLVYPLTHSLAA